MRTIFVHTSHEERNSRHCEIFTHSDKTFKINIEIRNGDCIGFNYNCYLSVMSADGNFIPVVDNREIGVPFSNCYHESSSRRLSVILDGVEGFKAFVRKVYKKAK